MGFYHISEVQEVPEASLTIVWGQQCDSLDVRTRGIQLVVTSLGQWQGRSIRWEAESSNDITATDSQIAAGCCVMNLTSLTLKIVGGTFITII